MIENYPSEADIRQALVSRADQFCEITGRTRSEIGKSAINDGAFISRAADGRNFTMDTYRRVMDWLDANWPAPIEQREQQPS